MIDFSLSQVVQRHRHFRPGRAHAPDVSFFGFQVTHCPPFCFCVRHFVSLSTIMFLCPPFCFWDTGSAFSFCVRHFASEFAILFLCQPFCFCASHFVSVSAHFVSVPNILFLCPPFCFCVRHFVSVSTILFLGGHGVSHFLSVSAHFVSVSATLFLCPPFCFQVLPFRCVRFQIFHCPYLVSCFLTKISEGPFNARFSSRGFVIFPCQQVFFHEQCSFYIFFCVFHVSGRFNFLRFFHFYTLRGLKICFLRAK
jgi:hypothetical protein